MVCEVEPLLHNQDVPLLAVRLTDPPTQKLVAPPAVMVAVGNALTVTIVALDVAEHPFALVTVTVNVPEFDTDIV